MSESAVPFAANSRLHISFAVSSLPASLAFYRELFDTPPSKVRDDYARIEVDEPSLNLSLLQSPAAAGPADPTSHFGIQLKSLGALARMQDRLVEAGVALREERGTNCCHALQDKVWVSDPDGFRWEIFVVLDDAPTGDVDESDCCSPSGAACCPEASAQ